MSNFTRIVKTQVKFVKFDIRFLRLPQEIFFGVITDNKLHSIATEKCKKECDIV